MRIILMLGAAALTLVGCVGYEGPSRGIVGTATAPFGSFSGISTTARTGEKPMGYRKGADGSLQEMYGTWTDGQRNATGIPAHKMAEAHYLEKLLLVCAVAPNIAVCNK